MRFLPWHLQVLTGQDNFFRSETYHFLHDDLNGFGFECEKPEWWLEYDQYCDFFFRFTSNHKVKLTDCVIFAFSESIKAQGV